MPTFVRYISKMVVFILVIAVSGVGAAHAQTDPDSVPPSTDQEELSNPFIEAPQVARVTPDLVAKSARLYETDEQIILNSDDDSDGGFGPVDYWFALDWSSGHHRVDDLTMWYFYTIDGYDDRFFIQVAGTAGSNTYMGSVETFEPFIDASNSTARLARSDPHITTVIPDPNGEKTTFEVGFDTGTGLTAGVKAEIPARAGILHPIIKPSRQWYSVRWERGSSSSYGTYPFQAITNSFVSYWEGDPEGIAVATCGYYKETPHTSAQQWGECREPK